MSKEQNPHLEPEERNDKKPVVSTEADVIQDDFENPIAEPVKNKDYSRHNVTASAEQLTNPIPEPAATAPPIDLTRPKVQPSVEPKQERAPEPPPIFNQQMSQLKGKDKRDAAERAVDVILDGYAWLKKQSNELLKISGNKLKKMERQGKVSLSIPIPIDDLGNTLTVGEFVNEFNRQNGDLMEFDDETREQLRPVMIQYFSEIGVGMTLRDELIYLGVKELIFFGAKMFQGLAIKKDMLNQLVELTQAYKSSGGPVMGQPISSPPSPPPPPPPAPSAGQNGSVAGSDHIPPDEDDLPVVTDNHEQMHNSGGPSAGQNLHMMGPDAAMVMVGAINPAPPAVKPNRKRGRLKKEEEEKRKADRIAKKRN